ncbi:MAG: PRC-barrel domain-containing protein [Pirellulaceae bacterium]
MKTTRWEAVLAVAGLALVMLVPAGAQEQRNAATKTGAQEGVRKVIASPQRASELMGMSVQNEAGQDLGEIEDLVIDVKSGQVRYVALSFGGFLGLGDKLFAVPMSALKLRHKGDSSHFVLNVNQERLKTAPGFNEDQWPDFGNPEFGAQVDKFYNTSTSRGESPRDEATTNSRTPGPQR